MTMMNVGAAGKEDAVRAKAELRGYFQELTAQRRRSPGEDLISTLATARDGDELLDDDELAVMAMVLLITGQDTTTYQLGNIAYTLLTRPDLMRSLRAEPQRLPRTLEELLRHIPFRKGVGIPRIALEDVELSGVLIKAGDVVHVSYLTANRDSAKFDRPDEAGSRPADHPPHDVRLGRPPLPGRTAGHHGTGSGLLHAADPLPGPASGRAVRGRLVEHDVHLALPARPARHMVTRAFAPENEENPWRPCADRPSLCPSTSSRCSRPSTWPGRPTPGTRSASSS
ncbi:cytochrome P450 [Streptomyces sp. S1A(2023)]